MILQCALVVQETMSTHFKAVVDGILEFPDAHNSFIFQGDGKVTFISGKPFSVVDHPFRYCTLIISRCLKSTVPINLRVVFRRQEF